MSNKTGNGYHSFGAAMSILRQGCREPLPRSRRGFVSGSPSLGLRNNPDPWVNTLGREQTAPDLSLYPQCAKGFAPTFSQTGLSSVCRARARHTTAGLKSTAKLPRLSRSLLLLMAKRTGAARGGKECDRNFRPESAPGSSLRLGQVFDHPTPDRCQVGVGLPLL